MVGWQPVWVVTAQSLALFPIPPPHCLYDTPMLAAAIASIGILVIWFAGAGALLLLIAGLIGATFAVAAAGAGQRPLQSGLGWARHIRLWLGEIAAAWSVFLFWMPLERLLMPRDCPPPAGGAASATGGPAHLPILLIHGYVNNAGALWRLWKTLCRKGFSVHTLNLEPVYGSIDQYAALIEARIAAICAASGAAQVTLVCHSMGGLAARAYLRHCAVRRVEPRMAKLITLGSPHHGTLLARIERSANGGQMRPHSAWLAALAAHEQSAWPCPLISIYSLDDNIVVPASSARLNGARNIELAGIGHISLPLARQVIDLVLGEMLPQPA